MPLGDIAHPDMNSLLNKIRMMSPHLDLEKGPWLAGGSLRRLVEGGTKIGFDIDVFSNIELTVDHIRELTHDGNRGGRQHGETRLTLPSPSAILPIQVTVKPHGRTFSSVEELLCDFDFTVCMFATDGKTIVFHKDSLDDLRNKRLRSLGNIKTPYPPIKSFRRIIKYIRYGFFPDQSVFSTITGEFPSFQEMSFYSSETIPINDQIGPDLTSRSFDDSIVMSKIGDIVCECIDGRYYAFIEGIPLPIEYGLLYFSSVSNKKEICEKMKPVWDSLELHSCEKRLERMCDIMTPSSFVRAIQEVIL